MKLQHIGLIALSAVVYCFGAVVKDIQADVNNLTGNITTFTDALPAFDPNTFPISAIPLLLAINGVLQALNESTTDAQALNHPVTNVTGLIAVVTPLSTTIPNALTDIVDAKPQFDAISTFGSIADGAVGGILFSLQGLVQAFTTATIAALPAGQKAPLKTVQNTIDAAFNSTIAAFGLVPA